MTLRHYQQEMRYLHEAGKAFAAAHPDEARFLNVDSLTDRDPYVERLFEGFALLTGRIQERLDDELPQFTESLLGLLWPHLLRPVPALSIVEFRPTPGLVQKATPIPRGAEVRSAPVGDEATSCRFTTTQDVRLRPLRLVDAALAWPRDDATTLTLRFRLDRGTDFAGLELDALRLHFHADPAIASLMHLFFTRHVARVVVRPVGGGDELRLDGQRWVRPSGFAEGEELLDYAPTTFHGFRLLQEYLAFRAKFWSVELLGLGKLTPPPKTTEFEVELHFDRAYPERQRFGAESIRLHCTPVVNLFREDAEPLAADHRAAEYRVVPDVHRPTSVEPYDVEEVVGVEEQSGRRHEYGPYFALRHGPDRPRWFTVSRRARPDGRPALHLTLGGAPVEELRPEKLSLGLRCTNGSLPRERLRERTITQLGPDLPHLATVDNLTQPTLDLPPPLGERGDLLWRLLSHLSLGHRSVATREGLADLLELYDWTGSEANRRRIAGILSVAWTPTETIRRRAVVRGATVEVKVQDGHFADEGDLCLFGMVLSRVLAAYATLNSFVHLAIVVAPSGVRYEWRPDSGTSPLL